MNEIKARINSLGELIEIGHIEGLELCCPMPFDFIDRFYNYKPTVLGNSITHLSVIDEYIDWHDRESKIQIKLTHQQNSELLINYPEFGVLVKQLELPVFSEPDYLYIYCNFLEETHRQLLKPYITER